MKFHVYFLPFYIFACQSVLSAGELDVQKNSDLTPDADLQNQDVLSARELKSVESLDTDLGADVNTRNDDQSLQVASPRYAPHAFGWAAAVPAVVLAGHAHWHIWPYILVALIVATVAIGALVLGTVIGAAAITPVVALTVKFLIFLAPFLYPVLKLIRLKKQYYTLSHHGHHHDTALVGDWNDVDHGWGWR